MIERCASGRNPQLVVRGVCVLVRCDVASCDDFGPEAWEAYLMSLQYLRTLGVELESQAWGASMTLLHNVRPGRQQSVSHLIQIPK